MIKAFKYRLYPNKNQQRELVIMLETHRRLYNTCLSERKNAWEDSQKSINYKEQSKAFTSDRKTNPYYARLNFSSAQATMRRLQKSFNNFFRRIKRGEKPGYPRFKATNRFSSWTYPSHGDGVRFHGEKVKLQHIGFVRVKYHRSIDGDIKTVSIKNECSKWYVIVTCDIGESPEFNSCKPGIGLDVGIEYFLTTSNGDHVENSRFLKSKLKELRVTQRSVSRKKKDGNNRRKAVTNLQKIHTKIRNQRKDFHHKVARDLVDSFGVIAVESLNIQGMIKNHRLAQSISDVGWGRFLLILKNKAENAGSSVLVVDPKNTSQLCSGCGTKVKKGLSVRTHKCPKCKLVLQRDHNAAKNILAKAIRGRNGPVGLNVKVA